MLVANTMWHQKTADTHAGTRRAGDYTKSFQKKISDHIAFGLLVYTGLNIFVTMHAIKGAEGSILPYFGLVVLVAAIIPACLKLEHRWKAMEEGRENDESLRGAFNRDRILIWMGAIGLPFAVTAIYQMLAGTA